jgi:hypothetical protein
VNDPHFFKKARTKAIQDELEKLVDENGRLDPETSGQGGEAQVSPPS